MLTMIENEYVGMEGAVISAPGGPNLYRDRCAVDSLFRTWLRRSNRSFAATTATDFHLEFYVTLHSLRTVKLVF